MTTPIEGKLSRDDCERWCIEGECTLTSGSVVQIRINDLWLQGRIEWPISSNGARQFHETEPPDFTNRSHLISSNGSTYIGSEAM